MMFKDKNQYYTGYNLWQLGLHETFGFQYWYINLSFSYSSFSMYHFPSQYQFKVKIDEDK